MNYRTIHILLGGINSGKSTFAKYLQIGKKNVYRICMDEIRYSIGLDMYDDRMFKILLSSLLRMGDVVVDGGQNFVRDRKRTIEIGKGAEASVYCYIVKRPQEDCVDEFNTIDEIKASLEHHQPLLSEGFDKIFVVKWKNTHDAINYGDEALMIKPEINLLEEMKDSRPVVVKPKKKVIKRKLEHGRQNLFRPKKNQ